MTSLETKQLDDSEFSFFIDLCLLGIVKPSEISLERMKELARPTV